MNKINEGVYTIEAAVILTLITPAFGALLQAIAFLPLLIAEITNANGTPILPFGTR